MADKKARDNFLVFWKINPDKLKEQVEQYNSLKIYRSARGISFLWLVFSSIVSLLLIAGHTMPVNSLADVALFLFFGIFIYVGYRWAMIGGMIFWTIEKFYAITTAPTYFIVQLIWWTLYMHYFYLAFKVEQQKRNLAQNENKE
jgi:hypothetical protein